MFEKAVSQDYQPILTACPTLYFVALAVLGLILG